MENIDYRKILHTLYAPSAKKFTLVDVPSMNFIWAEGKGDPNTSPHYREIVEALYAVAYTIKFMVKKGKGKISYRVMPLEGLWWVPNMETFSTDRKDRWLWRMMIMQPEPVTEELFKNAVEMVRTKKNPAAIDALSFGNFYEGQCAQLLYVGPYHDEGPTINRLHEYIAGLGGRRTGRHHEIYLNDPRKTAPEKLRTVIRQPLTRQE